ncbi:hypothetical protein ACWGDE_01635 [Streptomyces sp. NPDC054956]
MAALLIFTGVVGVAFVVVSMLKRSVEARAAEASKPAEKTCDHHCCRCPR